jgi:hypothetical protein
MFSRPPSRRFPGSSNRAKEEEPLSGRERAVAGTLGLLVVFMPWAFGSRNVWAQWIALGLAVVAMACALAPARGAAVVTESGDGVDGEGAGRAGGWRRLVRFPLFWLGLVYLGFVTCQALNPAAVLVSTPLWWRLDFVEPIAWLPSGVDAPFARMNAWRVLVIHGAAWLAVCAAWTGLTRGVDGAESVHRRRGLAGLAGDPAEGDGGEGDFLVRALAGERVSRELRL